VQEIPAMKMQCYNCNFVWKEDERPRCPECNKLWNPFCVDFTTALMSDAKLIFVNTGEWERLRDGILSSIIAENERLDKIDEARTLLRYGDVTMMQGWDDRTERFTSEHQSVDKGRADDPIVEQVTWFRDQFDSHGVLWIDDHQFYLDSESEAYKEQLMTALRNFVRINEEPNGVIETRKTIIISGENVDLGEELRHEAQRVELPLPNIPVLKQIIEIVADENELDSDQVDTSDEFAQTAIGLSSQQAMAAFRKAIVMTGGLIGDEAMKLVIKQKSSIVAESGCLEFMELNVDMESVGGLENLKCADAKGSADGWRTGLWQVSHSKSSRFYMELPIDSS
jgi:hypothetical protein